MSKLVPHASKGYCMVNNICFDPFNAIFDHLQQFWADLKRFNIFWTVVQNGHFLIFKMVRNGHKRPQMILHGQKHYLQPIWHHLRPFLTVFGHFRIFKKWPFLTILEFFKNDHFWPLWSNSQVQKKSKKFFFLKTLEKVVIRPEK